MKVAGYLICFLFGLEYASSQNLNVGILSDFETLSGVQVNDIKQDSIGFLWIGTMEGLYRYDGNTLKLYETHDRFIGSSIIQVIFITSKNEIWAGTKGGLLKYDKYTDQFISFRHDPDNEQSIHGNIINSIEEDHAGNLWVGLSEGGLDLFKKRDNIFYHYLKTDNTGLLSDDISDLHFDSENNLWISTWNNGVHKLDLKDPDNSIPSSAKFKSYKPSRDLTIDNVIPFLFEDPYTKDLYVAIDGYGFQKYNKELDSFTNLKIDKWKYRSLYHAIFFSANKIWASTSDGLKLINLENTLENCSQSICDIIGPVRVVFIDRQNITWIGFDNGLKKSIEKKIKRYRLDNTKNVAPSNNIMALCKQGNYLWLGTWGGGLFLKDERNGNLIRVNPENDILTTIWDIKLVRNDFLLVATCKGLVRLRVNQMSFRNNFEEYNFPSEHFFTALTKNTTGDTWIGTWQGGLYMADERTGIVKKYPSSLFDNHFIQCVHLDKSNRLWIGTVHSGLIRINVLDKNSKSNVYSRKGTSATKITSDFVSVLLEDDKERLWIGTGDAGINILDLKTEKLRWIVKGEHNLSSNSVRAIIQDNLGNMWVSSKSGLSKYNTINEVFINYTKDDGLEDLEFNPKAVAKNDSVVYFGNQSGYNSFKPAELEFQHAPPAVLITDFKIFNKSILPGEAYEGDIILSRPISETQNLNLNHKAKNISFEFSALDFTNPKQEIYAYRLEGVDEDWIYTNAFSRHATYSNLAPGNYIFKVKTTRNNILEQDESTLLNIYIIPPIWQRNWFKIISALLFISGLYVVHWMRLTGLRRQKILFEKLAKERVKVIENKNSQLEKQNQEIQHQAAKLHEADQSKLIFFTNISHEFRTPLMLIIGPITNLLKHPSQRAERQGLFMIHRNAQRLLRLMDQIMDISKIEAGRLVLELTEGDVVKFIEDIASSFTYLANENQIEFKFNSAIPEHQCFFDHDKIEKITYNLLSNAIKVTPESGRITFALDIVESDLTDTSVSILKIEISDSGSGIKKDELPHLFTRFYRTGTYAEGTGMGLSLTKSLVELHHGTITVESSEEKGTCFSVAIPVSEFHNAEAGIKNNGRSLQKQMLYSAEVELANGISCNSTSLNLSLHPHAKTILILDDNEDMRSFISQLLISSYHVLQASLGEAAIKLAREHQPNLIISDMMMPIMDGYQFLRAIKSDPDVSHIPVIMLTAKSNIESRLQGYEEGADDYITKPFDERILMARIKYLIDKRQMVKDRFATDINIAPNEIAITSLDEKFLQNLLALVEVNISSPDFGSDIICQELGVSRSHLYTKVKALTDLSVNEFIKTIRLKRAAALLTKGQQNVNEVAYRVGFNDRYYFSKCFVKQFGVSPAQYQKSN